MVGDGLLYAIKSHLRLRRSPPQAGLESETARSAGHRLPDWATGAPLWGDRRRFDTDWNNVQNNQPYVPVVVTEPPAVNP